MENVLTKEQLNTLDKSALIEMIMSQTQQLKELNLTLDKLVEQIAISNNARFGKKSEAGLVDENQVSFFNEVEALASSDIPEPTAEIVVASYKRKKKAGKREEDLKDFPSRIIKHSLSEEELAVHFPGGYTKLPDEIYKKLEYHPAWHEVLEHHIEVYKDKASQKIIKAKRPVEMLNKSIATPSLASCILNAKYTNSLPLYRIEQEFARNEINISRQTMANWVITLSERYLSLIYDRLKSEIKKASVVHADETPVTVTKDGRETMHKSYMWVYRTGTMCKANPAIIYEYQKTRAKEHPLKFLEGFNGKLVCDGYSVYHNIEAEEGSNFEIAGCWAHARRPFAEVVKAAGKDKAKGTVAYEALAQISNIYYIDNALAKLPASERKKRRKLLVKPEVDAFFTWIKSHQNDVPPSSKTSSGINYCINQEKYLRTFLTDPQIPLDNNAAERAIRGFCIGKNNWRLIDTINGANASAVVYSIVETAKANDLKIYEYLK